MVHFGHRGGEGKEDEVAGGDVGNGDVGGHLGGGAALGDGDVIGEGGAAENAEIESESGVMEGTQGARDVFGGGEFVAMALAIVDGEGAACEAIAAGNGKSGGAVKAATEEDDGLGLRG
jgi:hypothetical protein